MLATITPYKSKYISYIRLHSQLGQMPSATFSFLQQQRLRHWTMKYHGSPQTRVTSVSVRPFVWCLPEFKSYGRNQACLTVVNLSSEGGKHGKSEGGRGKLFQSFWQRKGVPVLDEKGPWCQQGTGCKRIRTNFRTKEPLSTRGQESRFTGEVVKSNHKTGWERAIRSAST